MPCNQSQLNALADGELGIWATARLRSHLRTCPACAEEYQAIQNLGIQMQTWRDIKTPDGLQARIASVLPQARPLTAQKRLAWRPLAAVAVAAVVFAAIVLFTPGQPGRPAPAIADVERAMGTVQNASWKMVLYDSNALGRPLTWTRHYQTWVRRMPPAIAGYDVEFDERDLQDARGYVDYSPSKNTYIQHPPEKDINKDVADVMRRMTEPIIGANDVKPSAGTHWTPWQRKRVMLAGHPCWKFSREERRDHVRLGSSDAPVSHGLSQMNLWADTTTLRIARIEFNRTGHSNSGIQGSVFSNFRYNQTPPKGVFDWSPPPGAKEFKPGAHAAPKSGAAKPSVR